MSYPGQNPYGAPGGAPGGYNPQGAAYGGAPPQHGHPGGAPGGYNPQGAAYGAAPPQHGHHGGAPGGYNPQGAAYGGAPPGAAYGGAAPPGGAYGHGHHAAPGGQHGGYSPYGASMGPGQAPPQPTERFNKTWYASYYRQVDQRQMHTLWLWFSGVDADRSGSISAPELAKMTFPGQGPVAGKPIGLANAKKAVTLFDQDKGASLDFHEYAAFFQFCFALQNAFYAGDRDRSGFLDQQETWNALSAAGFKTEYAAVQAYFKKMVPKGKRGLDIYGFITLAFTMAVVRQKFHRLDKSNSGKVNLDQVYQICAEYAKAPANANQQCTIF